EKAVGGEERTSFPDRSEVSLEERKRIVREHLELETSYAGEQAGVRNFRKHILWYTKGLRHSAALRQQLGSLGRGGEMLAVLQVYFEDMNKMNNGLDFS
ncbi:MAG: tRNA-dihydrouridine synthase, partial [Syntrophobacterales bacterium]|nr:tRNA-dihydrouridine synthase [Syntrophobacterales bacterium]